MDSLTLLVFLPLLGALVVALTPRDAVAAQRGIALATLLAVCALGLKACLAFDGSSAASQQLVDVPWFALPAGGWSTVAAHFTLGLDRALVHIVQASALLGPPGVV